MTRLSPAGSTVAIDPARLAPGEWCHRTEKRIGQGDIDASYSADRIGMGQPIRKPFSWRGGLWVCVVNCNRSGSKAYRLTHPAAFAGIPVTYREKTMDCEAARADANGFYHGMTVTHAGKPFVLIGPPVIFMPGQTEQLSLF